MSIFFWFISTFLVLFIYWLVLILSSVFFVSGRWESSSWRERQTQTLRNAHIPHPDHSPPPAPAAIRHHRCPALPLHRQHPTRVHQPRPNAPSQHRTHPLPHQPALAAAHSHPHRPFIPPHSVGLRALLHALRHPHGLGSGQSSVPRARAHYRGSDGGLSHVHDEFQYHRQSHPVRLLQMAGAGQKLGCRVWTRRRRSCLRITTEIPSTETPKRAEETSQAKEERKRGGEEEKKRRRGRGRGGEEEEERKRKRDMEWNIVSLMWDVWIDGTSVLISMDDDAFTWQNLPFLNQMVTVTLEFLAEIFSVFFRLHFY